MINSSQTINSSIGALVREMEEDYINGKTTVSKYVDFSLCDDINRIDAYLNSKHISGDKDSLGREKPFFNIVLAKRNIWYRATDIDRKDIIVKPPKSKDTINAFLATVHLHNWMKRENFGKFLNNWGMVMAGYNEAVVKFVEQDGKLKCVVIPWGRIICDVVDFENNPKIEIIELTPAQLRKRKGYDQKIVKNLIDTWTVRETIDGQKKDTKSKYIKLYEIHGELPKSYLTDNDNDAEKYTQQMQVISFVKGKEEGVFDDFILISGEESKDPYLLTALLPEPEGYISLKGSVKNLFDAQWMVNDSVKRIKDQLDLASLMILQTSDGNLQSQNALQAMVTGDFIIHAQNQPIEAVNFNVNGITMEQNYQDQWKVLAQEITGTPDVMMGNNMPSGTAWRQAQVIQAEAHDNFETMTENKGLAIEEMMRNFILPFIKKKMDTKEEIGATLEMNGIDRIDELFIRNEAMRRANYRIVQTVIDGYDPTREDQQTMIGEEQRNVKEALAQMGNHRFYKPDDIDEKSWKDVLKDFEWDVDVVVTNEYEDKNAVLQTLNTMLQTIAANPAILQDPNARMLFNKILNESGVVSPMEINSTAAQAQTIGQPQAQPAPAAQ